jgi:hypothetical protein
MPNFLPMMTQVDYRRALRRVRHDELGRTMLNLLATTPAQFADKVIRAEGYGHQIEQLKLMHTELAKLIEAKAQIDAGLATLAAGSVSPDGALAAYRECIARMDAALDHYGQLYLPALAEAGRRRHDKRLSHA